MPSSCPSPSLSHSLPVLRFALRNTPTMPLLSSHSMPLLHLAVLPSGLYNKLTPDMYEASSHSTHGYIVLLLSLTLSVVDIPCIFHPSLYVLESSFQNLIVPILAFSDDNTIADSSLSEQIVFDTESPQPPRHSDDTLREIVVNPIPRAKQPLLRRIAQGAYATLERVLVFAAFGMVLSGIVTYTGGCRDSYINNCLAHLIKGGIFWCYGLFTFARFLGSHSEMGWAWNISPIGNTISAEFVESTVIFLYGISNTWMERFGAKAGDPYTTKQVQHVSIAVMFWFAGLIGMGMESRRVRRWLAASATASLGSARPSSIPEPPSYRASFNPFPALVIGVTGAAMSAHAQAYVFQVQIHQLWGWLLLGFSVLRCLTYFFVWLGPPNSLLPSRPPTEALGSFFLACGGLMFILSTEEVTLAAMRKGRDDMMMFLNVAVAITCFAFCWTFCVVAFNGWLKSRKPVA
ncbi:hypothetical protein JVU11DRAFT_1812 [Chiua virens]|nr:hypothetical protein JVU11DRAFT_1812 [Chiua virens]